MAASLWDTHHVLFLDGGGVGEAPWDKAMATHPSILAWKVPWTEEPGGLQSTEVAKSRQNKAEQLTLVPEEL